MFDIGKLKQDIGKGVTGKYNPDQNMNAQYGVSACPNFWDNPDYNIPDESDLDREPKHFRYSDQLKDHITKEDSREEKR